MTITARATLGASNSTYAAETVPGALPPPVVFAHLQNVLDSVPIMGTTVSPTALSGDVSAYAPTNFAAAKTLLLTSDATIRTITGFAAGVEGEIKSVININASTPLLVLPRSGAEVHALAAGRGLVMQYHAATGWCALQPASGVSLSWYNKAAPGVAAAPYITLDNIQAGTTAGPGQQIVGRPFIANYCEFAAVTALTGASITVTLQKNGVDTAITFSIADGGATGSDAAHVAQFARGDKIGIKALQSGTAAQAAWHGRFVVGGPAL